MSGGLVSLPTMTGRRTPWLVDVGLCALVALVVAMSIGRIVIWLRWIIGWPGADDAWWSALPALGAVLGMLVVHRASATPATVDAYAFGLNDGALATEPVPARSLATALGVGLGVPLGFDGPMLYFGGAMGAVGARWARRPQRWCVLAGGTASLAMVISAPVAAALFASEVARRGFPRRADITPLAMGAGASSVVLWSTDQSGGVFGADPGFATRQVAIAAIVIGLVAGGLGRVIVAAIQRAKRVQLRLAVRLMVVDGALLVAIPGAWLATDNGILLGSGERLRVWAEQGSQPAVLAATCVFAALVLAMVVGGVVGGLFLPLVSFGGLVGLLLGRSWLPDVPLAACIGLGGCALLAAGYGTPLTAAALAFSIFGWSSTAWLAVGAVTIASVLSGQADQAGSGSVSVHRLWPHVRS